MLNVRVARSLRRMARFYTNRVTFEMAIEENEDGLINRVWRPVPHPVCEDKFLVDLPCLRAPDAGVSGQTERGLATHTINSSRQRLALPEYYPNLVPSLRAVVDGVLYNIVGIADDNESGMLLLLERSSA